MKKFNWTLALTINMSLMLCYAAGMFWHDIWSPLLVIVASAISGIAVGVNPKLK